MSSPASPDVEVVEGETDGDLRAARRTLVFFAVALAACVTGFALVLTGGRGDDGGSTVADRDALDAPETVASIGPTPGDSVRRHVDERRAALDATEGRRVAVVSLTGYSTVDAVDDLLTDLELDRYLIAVVGGAATTTRDVAATVDDITEDAAEQLAEIEAIAPTVEDDPDYSTFYAEEIDRYRRLLEAAGGDGDDAVVFGFVVTGSASDLRALASRASVRVVDVGDSDRLDRDAPVRGIRPEETTTVGEPPFRT